jgi:hypothetical protein
MFGEVLNSGQVPLPNRDVLEDGIFGGNLNREFIC